VYKVVANRIPSSISQAAETMHPGTAGWATMFTMETAEEHMQRLAPSTVRCAIAWCAKYTDV